MDKTAKELLQKVADIKEVPKGAHSIREDGGSYSLYSTETVKIKAREDKMGIDIHVLPGSKGETVHIPVIITASGLKERVVNTFLIGEGADVNIVAGCGIHNCGTGDSQHDGLHTFHLEKNAKLKYTEKHYGEGDGGKRFLNPKTELVLEKGSQAILEMVQIEGVDDTTRETVVELEDDASLLIQESMLTDGQQRAKSIVDIILKGENADAQIISRSVAKGNSRQEFELKMTGRNHCRGHIQCDSIIMDSAQVSSVPEIRAEHEGASLIHEAAIGRIASDQLIKLMTLGLNTEQAEKVVIESFLNEEV